jgi:hypothetical protein
MPDYSYDESANDTTTYDGGSFGQTDSTLGGSDEGYADDTTTYDGGNFGEDSYDDGSSYQADDTTTY